MRVDGGAGSSELERDLYRPFQPRRARVMAWTVAVVELVALVLLAATLPGGAGPVGFHWYDRLGVVLIGVLVALVLVRFARIRAVPDPTGITVHNVVLTTRLDWAQIVSVRFGGGNPWATLDLSDGQTLAVMAIQRADAQWGVAQSRRLATLVALHSDTTRND